MTRQEAPLVLPSAACFKQLVIPAGGLADKGRQAPLMATGVLGACGEAAGLSQEESPGAFTCSSGAVRAPPGFMGPFPLQGKSSRKTSLMQAERLEGLWGERCDEGAVLVFWALRSSARMYMGGNWESRA